MSTTLFALLLVTAPLGPTDALHVADGRFVNQAGEVVSFYGVNLFQSHLMWSRRQQPDEADAALTEIARLGFNAVRMPLNLAWFEPAQGVFPDSPEYEAILKQHRLPTGAIAFYDGLVKRAGELGIYVIPEFHELPIDPYRWFVGGEERDRGTGKPGTAICWLGLPDEQKPGQQKPNDELIGQEVPKALGWLAKHWRGVPNIAAIEVPWNEPRGPLTDGATYYDLCQACARAIKAEDPTRLTAMDAIDWGAMVNKLTDESTWRTPPEVDALFPHFYPGMHSGSSGEAGTWSTSLANWASWLTSSGKPVMVGEYGVVEMKRAKYWANDPTPEQRRNTLAAAAAQWYAQGVQGLFCWAWDGGIDRDKETGELTRGAEVLPNWAAPYEASVPNAATAKVAVICAPRRRAQYGSRQDLWQVTDALLGAHLTPFVTVFESQVVAQPETLQRFGYLLVLQADLSQQAAAVVKQASRPTTWLSADLGELPVAVAAARQAVGAPDLPDNVILGTADRQLTVYERLGQAGEVTLKVTIPGANGAGRLVDETGTVVYQGDAATQARDGLLLDLTAYACRVYRWQP